MSRSAVFASLAVFSLVACSDPGKPQKAENVGTAEGGAVSASDGSTGSVPDPVATVNDVPVTAAQFNAIYDLKLQKYRDRDREIPKTADRRYRKSITERLIYQEALRQAATERGVDYDKAELAAKEETQKKGVTDWEKHLRRRGESEESLREMYIAELREQAILKKEGKLGVEDSEIDAEYEKTKANYKKDQERVRASHILVRVGPGEKQPPADPTAQPSEEQKKAWEAEGLAKAESIYAEVMAPGADFEKIAEKYSDAPSRGGSGSLGIFTAERMVAEFSNVAFAMEPGAISKPVKTKFGFHIIKLHGKYPPGDLPKEALADELRERLEARKLHDGKRALKDELFAKFGVVNKMEELLGPDPRAKNRREQGDDKDDHDDKDADGEKAEAAEKVAGGAPEGEVLAPAPTTGPGAGPGK